MNIDETASAPRPDRPLIAIGDLHGCSAKLNDMLDRVAAELLARDIEDADLVTLGDYVDRGEDSRAVIQTLMAFQETYPGLLTPLMGNHEKMLLDFLDRPEERGGRFLRHGGLQTLASFGVGGVIERARPEVLAAASEKLRQEMADGMEDWLRNLPLWKQSGDVICVHAAMDPVAPPELQESRPMLWGHPFFYKAPRPDGLWVVHGHDVVEEPRVHERRVSCDTGAYFSGRLTAAMIVPGEAVQFLTV
ncbi:Bis(5'-nucleosyl)-tetraphosphatase PrpE [asymmetrical] [Rhodobacteraceae bacterium THAF1]|uniref:metallophosphoesterase family protein n=1 Tax=Palleronia sp. THAF1 TaxID=2587842 RepID=UPI000F3E9F72|nr:metallophosphoesterase family protein [Palleronia sp. THAF1]QFU10095.1 Bis(5'-nucleosyl)-tetraphosphatase PrpE [asymmetrical] [Palleronia sp. THAF1]VDC17000.1 Bis(5'-nucleosyl)-tetraphosphatase PrpE [asymmetrical] [Rhodobacteraceae bacterium THAF1]